MAFDLQISENKRFIIYRPESISNPIGEFVDRIAAIGRFADRYGVSRILADYRDKAPSLDAGLFDTILAAPELSGERKWRVAILFSIGAQSYSLELASYMADFLEAKGQEAKLFIVGSEAEAWLLDTSRDST